jgi:uncharacterized protein YndB with AHSA1/START domain
VTGVTDVGVAPPTGARLALLRRLGFGQLQHDSHVPFLSHLLGTRRLLVEWCERPALCDAGLFHSVYGTEYFEPDLPASRDEVRGIIGDEAEEIAHTWCTIRRDTIDVEAPPTALDRHTGERFGLSDRLVADVATLWAADTVEQLARMAPGERAFARTLERVLHVASPAAQRAARRVLPLLDDVPQVVRASAEVHADAATIFELIADPARQPEWDGNDNLAVAATGQRVRAVGDVFVMELTRGTIRHNTVVEFVEGRVLAWQPSEPGAPPPGHLWRWELEPLDTGRTRVTHTYDWTRLADPDRFERARATTSDRLAASLDRLAALAEGRSGPT